MIQTTVKISGMACSMCEAHINDTIRRDERIYVQVCVQLPENSDREVGNLMEIKDHYPKYVVTLNEMDTGIENGIRIVHLADFLLSEQL